VTDRTVTVVTTDHGPITIPEPPWCTGTYHPAGIARDEISHSGPVIDVLVGTERGPQRLAELLLWQVPFPAPDETHGDAVHVVVQLLDGHHYGYDAPALEALAVDLTEAAAKVRRVARRLAAEVPGGDR
jgi:hypothetical protein